MTSFYYWHWPWLVSYPGINPRLGVWGVTTPRFWAGGREILLYLFMYRMYVRKWWLLKRNRIIWPEVVVNEQFLPGKSKFSKNCLKKFARKNKNSFKDLPGQIKIFCKIAWRNRNFSEMCLEKSKFCWPGSTTPQISNQIDAAGSIWELVVWSLYVILRQRQTRKQPWHKCTSGDEVPPSIFLFCWSVTTNVNWNISTWYKAINWPVT